MQVKFSRTITQNGTLTETGKCGRVATSQMEFNETESFGSEAFPMSDDTDTITLDAPTDPMPSGAKPLTGSGSLDFHSTEEGHACTTSGSSKLAAHADADLSNMHFSLRYSRKTTQGTLTLSPGFNPAKGTGTIKVHAPPNPEQTADGAAVAGNAADVMAGMGNADLSTAAQWKVLGSAAGALRESAGLLAQDADMTVAKNGSGFVVNFRETRDFPADKTGPSTNTGLRTVTTMVTVTIGGPPDEYEAILAPVTSMPGVQLASYSTFVPIGPKPSAADGTLDSVAFRVYLVSKSAPTREVSTIPFQVTYTLDTSHEPGNSINMPANGQADNDLEWHPLVARIGNFQQQTDTTLSSKPDHGADLIAIVRSRDFGAYGKLHAHVHTATQELDAHLAGKSVPDARIPLDDNDNHIADAWEAAAKVVGKGATSDDEHFDGNTFDGDGLTLYEEYRGAFVGGTHVRLDPNKKDLFVLNLTKRDLKPAAAIFETAARPSIVVRICIDGEIPTGTRIINANSSFAKGGAQHAVIAFDKPTPTPGGTAQTVVDAPPGTADGVTGRSKARNNRATSPGHVTELDIDFKTAAAAVKNDAAKAAQNQAYATAHELGHAVGISHHGELSETVEAFHGLVTSGTAYIVDIDGRPIAWPEDPHIDIARLPSEASGDLGCIMSYNNLYDFAYTNHHAREFPLLVAKLKKEGKVRFEDQPVIVHIESEPARPEGTTLCKSKAGTDLNKPTANRPSVFGDGLKDCWSQLRVKDW